jgi:signal peptidase II
MIAKVGTRLALTIVVLATIGCDRVTKHVASITLAGTPSRSLLADTVRLVYSENTGGFLSLGANLPPAARTAVFTIATALLLLGMVVFAVRARWSGWRLVALALFAAGGASNWIDRAVRGSVIDFLNVGIGPVRTGIFNVADMAIMAGIGIFLLIEIAEHRRARASSGHDAS